MVEMLTCIIIGTILIYKTVQSEINQSTKVNKYKEDIEKEMLDDDELIATIFPTINDKDQK